MFDSLLDDMWKNIGSVTRHNDKEYIIVEKKTWFTGKDDNKNSVEAYLVIENKSVPINTPSLFDIKVLLEVKPMKKKDV